MLSVPYHKGNHLWAEDISFHFHTSAPYFLRLLPWGIPAPSAFASVALRRCGFPQNKSQENYRASVKPFQETPPAREWLTVKV